MTRLQTICHLVQDNGFIWFGLYTFERITIRFSSFFHKKRIQYETKRQLPGFNTVRYNYKEWSNYNWNKSGEEWSESPEWKEALIKEVIEQYLLPGKTILEIGPGGGRWSETLAQCSSELILVDLTEKSIDVCKTKLYSYPHCSFFVNDGVSLSFLMDTSVDYLWSFDVFVHIAPHDIKSYLKEIKRVFRKGSIGIIHHSIKGTQREGFRSSVTNELFLNMLVENNFRVINQITFWGKGAGFTLKENDAITVFSKE